MYRLERTYHWINITCILLVTQKRQWQWGGTYKAMWTEVPKFILEEARPHTPGRKLLNSSRRKTNRLKTSRLHLDMGLCENALTTTDVNVLPNSWILISSTTSSFPLEENYSFLRHMDDSDCLFVFTSTFAFQLNAHIHMLHVYRTWLNFICVVLHSKMRNVFHWYN